MNRNADISDVAWTTINANPLDHDTVSADSPDQMAALKHRMIGSKPLRNPFENRTQRRARERLEAKVAKVAKRIRANLKGLANSALNEMALSQTTSVRSENLSSHSFTTELYDPEQPT